MFIAQKAKASRFSFHPPRGHGEHQDEVPLISRCAPRGPDRPEHQAQPAEQPREERDLPHAPEVDVFPALMP
jgi:hypothetical protein